MAWGWENDEKIFTFGCKCLCNMTLLTGTEYRFFIVVFLERGKILLVGAQEHQWIVKVLNNDKHAELGCELNDSLRSRSHTKASNENKWRVLSYRMGEELGHQANSILVSISSDYLNRRCCKMMNLVPDVRMAHAGCLLKAKLRLLVFPSVEDCNCTSSEEQIYILRCHGLVKAISWRIFGI